MKAKKCVLSMIAMIAIGGIAFAAGVSVGQEKKTRVYELRTYTVLPGRLPALHKRFAEHTMKWFEKHGIRSEMYWAPIDDARKDNTLIYFVSHESMEAADEAGRPSLPTPSGSRPAMPARPTVRFSRKRPSVYS